MKVKIKRTLCLVMAFVLCFSFNLPVLGASGTNTAKYKKAVSSYQTLTKKYRGNYKIVDIDKNGIPELFYHNSASRKDEVYTYNYSKKKRVLLAKIDPGQNFMPGASYSGLGYNTKNKSFRIASADTSGIVEKYYKLSGTKLTKIATYESKRGASRVYTYKINGKKTGQDNFLKKLNALRKQYTVVKN